MSDQEMMTEIMGKIMKITDPHCLETIQNAAFNRKRDVMQSNAAVDTADWKVDDDVQLLPEHRGRKPYGADGKIIKINKVRMRVNFGNGMIYTVPKSMLMKT